MKKAILPILGLLYIAVVAAAEARPLWTFDQLFPPAQQQKMGLQKLTPAEKAELRTHVESLVVAAMRAAAARPAPEPGRAPAAAVGGTNVYITKITEDKDDVLTLGNGAIVKVTQGFLGFVGVRKDAALFKDGLGWKIWIDGKRAYKCEVLKAPAGQASGVGEKVTIGEVKGRGKTLTMLDGSMYEVEDLYTITTGLWLGNEDALVIDGTKLLNLESGGEVIGVKKIK